MQENIRRTDCESIDAKSPFSIYEENYCEKCDSYSGCIGLISSTSTSMGVEESEAKKNTRNIGDKMFFDMVKGMGVSLYTQKFKMILECMQARKLLNDMKY